MGPETRRLIENAHHAARESERLCAETVELIATTQRLVSLTRRLLTEERSGPLVGDLAAAPEAEPLPP